jgi:hypothetical protein
MEITTSNSINVKPLPPDLDPLINSVWLETRIDRVGVGFGADVGVRMLAGRLNICRDSSV